MTLKPEDLREKVARTLYERHPALRIETKVRGGPPMNRSATWEEATPDERADDYEAADAILALLSPADGWRPIETAPKDGTEVLAFRPDQGVFIARWAWMEEVIPRDQNGDPIEDYDDSFADWWHDAWGWLERELAPTHWQPLPAAPPKRGGQG